MITTAISPPLRTVESDRPHAATAFGPAPRHVRVAAASLPRPNRRRRGPGGCLLALILGGLVLPLALPARAQDSAYLDTTFSGDGIVVAPQAVHGGSAQDSEARALVSTAGGSSAILGHSGCGFDRIGFEVNSTGTPAGAFDGNSDLNDDGLAETPIGACDNRYSDAVHGPCNGLCLITDPPGYFFVAGTTVYFESTLRGFTVFKVSASSGKELEAHVFSFTDDGAGQGEAFGIAQRSSDGDLIAVGTHYSTPARVALVRLNRNGPFDDDLTVDSSFGGGDGIITHAIGSGDAIAYEVALQSDGKIVVVGALGSSHTTENGWPYTNENAFVARFTETGDFDTSFGTGGVVSWTAAGADGVVASGVQIASDGDIVVSGKYLFEGSCGERGLCQIDTWAGFVRRFTSTGAPETGFGGGDGEVTLSDARFEDVVLDSRGRITAVGSSSGSLLNVAGLLVGYTADGTLDPTFGGGDGRVTLPDPPEVTGLVVNTNLISAEILSDSDETIAVGGTVYPGGTGGIDRLFLARVVGRCGSADVDNDGVRDGCDNCPGTCNPDQDNADGDTGGGDVCDVCPAVDEAAEPLECATAEYNSQLPCCRAMSSAGISVDAEGPSCGNAGPTSFQTPPDPNTGTTVTVEIPSGAVDGPTSISVTPMTQGGGDFILSTAVGTFVTGAIMEPAGMSFDPPLLLCMAWVDADNNGRVDNLDFVVLENNIRPTLRDETTGTETVLGPRCGLQKQCGAFGVDGLPATVPGNLDDGSLRACCSAMDNVYCFEVTHFSAYAISDLSCAGEATARIIATRVDKPAGTQGLQVKGEFDLGAPIAGGLDPQASGFELVIQAADGSPLYQVTLPPGAFVRATAEGWKTSARGGKAQWQSKTGIKGVTKVKLEWDDATGQGSFDLKGKGLSLAVEPADLPLQAEVRFDPSALTGLCGLATWTSPGDVCAFNGSGTTLLCQ